MQPSLCFTTQLSEIGTEDMQNLITFLDQEQCSRGGHSELSIFENAEMLLLKSGLVGPLRSYTLGNLAEAIRK